MPYIVQEGLKEAFFVDREAALKIPVVFLYFYFIL